MDPDSELQVGLNSQRKQPSRKKCKGKEKVGEVVDKISDLPDHIIALLLSFLQTDEAVRTSILSSRWRYLWKGISNICLHHKDSGPDKFSDLLDHVLGNCTSTEFLTFELDCPLGIDVSRLNSWMSRLHSSRIKGLTVCANGTDPYTPPASPLALCVLSYRTLVTLKLQCCDIQIPESIDCFPHLKSLDLQVVFPHSKAAVNRLLACCPVLDKLDLFGWFNYFPLLNIYISSTTLTTLNLQLYNIGYAIDRDLCITIVAPNLESLRINDNSCARYEVKDISSVSNVSVNYEANSPFNLAFFKRIYKFYLLELFVGIGAAADVLTLLRSTVDVLGTALSYTWPTFKHLKILILHLDLVSGWRCMSKLLLSTPSLDVLILNLERIPENDSYQWTPPDVVPNCLLEHLKGIVIQQIEGNEDELKVIEYLLNSGQALQSMAIGYDPNKLNAEVMKKIRTFQRASKTCAITICDQIGFKIIQSDDTRIKVWGIRPHD